MSLFGILLLDDNKEVSNNISTNYEKSLKLRDGFYIVATNQKASKVAKTIGVYDSSQDEPALGVVFRINGSYAGFAPGRIWDWIDEQTEKDS